HFTVRTVAHPTLHSFPTRRSSDLEPRPGSRQGKEVERLALRKGPRGRPLPVPHSTHGCYWSIPTTRRAWRRCWSWWVPGCRHPQDRKSTRLNSSHQIISYAVFCLT